MRSMSEYMTAESVDGRRHRCRGDGSTTMSMMTSLEGVAVPSNRCAC